MKSVVGNVPQVSQTDVVVTNWKQISIKVGTFNGNHEFIS